jgi:hypothetical protein
VADNPIGEVNLRDNWGNAVVIQHAPNLYSVLAHLTPGGIEVSEGQYVTRGDRLGLCGNSGRSPVPHIHFQLQAQPRLGAPTVAIELHDIVTVEEEAETLWGTYTPQKGEAVRNIQTASEVARSLQFPADRTLRFTIETDGGERTETVRPEIDLYGRRTLRSEERDAILYFDRSDDIITLYDVVGDRRSILRIMLAALARVPFEVAESITWRDHLPRRLFSGPVTRLMLDFIAPFVRRDGFEMTYRARRDGRDFIVEGESASEQRNGTPRLCTKATIRNGTGLHALELRLDGETLRATVEQVDESTQTVDDDRLPESARPNDHDESDPQNETSDQIVAAQ